MTRKRIQTDVEKFLELTDRRGGSQEAVDLYAGALLSPLSGAWMLASRRQLEERYGQAVHDLCNEAVAAGRVREAVNLGHAALAKAPHREDIHVAIIRAYAAGGFQAEAIKQFEELERMLDETWGEVPSEQARTALEQAFKDRFAGKHNLPEELTSFVGRVEEVQTVCSLVARNRLVTLTGSGGCGKTRLALRVARQLLPEYVDGVWMVELAATTDPTQVPKAVASALGIPEQPGVAIQVALLDFLAPRRLLLVLDNCEHLLLACARLTEEILKLSPRVHILASSREGLAIGGEAIFRVPSLSTPEPGAKHAVAALLGYESVRLFVERAKAVAPDLTVGANQVSTLATICKRLDGIPLAIELAAARMRSLSLEEVNARLDDRFRLLTGGARTALPRQQTLRSLIDWSYDLLSEPEQALLRRLAVFAGGWTLDAATEVCSDPPVESEGVLNLLTSLCDKSLVVAESSDLGTRYRVLETIRQYARDRLLESGEGATRRDRHLAFSLSTAELADPKLRGPDQKEWLDRLEADHENFRAALEWASSDPQHSRAGLCLAGALGYYFGMRGYYREGLDWLDLYLAKRSTEKGPPIGTGPCSRRATSRST